jgi:hypothetical protein
MAVEVDLGIAGVSPPIETRIVSICYRCYSFRQKFMAIVIYVTENGF